MAERLLGFTLERESKLLNFFSFFSADEDCDTFIGFLLDLMRHNEAEN